MNFIRFSGVAFLACTSLFSQAPPSGEQPIYRVTVIARTAKAINYQHRSGATKIDFSGTQLLPNARGEAKVESKQGYIEIEVEFDNLEPASKNGAEYLTYVLWAITPEGLTSNLGEILLNGNKSKLNVTTRLQVFGLVVTAEPYFAVTRPSDLIVMENVVRPDTRGKIEEIDAKYELLQRGQYQRMSNPLALKTDEKIPLELYEARNAISIARSNGASTFATDTFQKAEKSLAAAEAYQSRKAGRKPVTMTAREAVQTAEDARAIAVKRQEEAALTAERQNSLDLQNRAENAALAARSDAERVSREAELARLNANVAAASLMQEKNDQAAAARNAAAVAKRESDGLLLDATRAKRESDRLLLEANLSADQTRLKNEAATAVFRSESERMQLENTAARANSVRLEADLKAQKAELRVKLLDQFSSIIETQDNARGLTVNMADVLFDTGQATLRPLAREKLSKLAGIVSTHSGLKVDIEGHTDNVGKEDYNQRLSENRGNSVRDFLTQQGISADSITSKGFGEAQPVAENFSGIGRQKNRRVELIISGDSIGTYTSKTVQP